MKIAYVMDPIEKIAVYKDSSFAMMEAAQARGHQNYYILPEQLYFQGQTRARCRTVQVQREDVFYTLGEVQDLALEEMDAVIMRQDPPFDMNYIYATYLLELVGGTTQVLNRPAALRDANEKLYALNFPSCIPKTLISSQAALIQDFVAAEQRAILKPLDSMGGEGVFVMRAEDSNQSAIIEMMTQRGRVPVVVQQYIPEAKEGDIRVLMVHGEVIGAIRRVPKAGEHRANLAAGGQAVAYELTEQDRAVCEQLAPALRAAGLDFVGLDLIGGYLIEVNVTSPTGIQELKRLSGIDAAEALIHWIETQRGEQA